MGKSLYKFIGCVVALMFSAATAWADGQGGPPSGNLSELAADLQREITRSDLAGRVQVVDVQAANGDWSRLRRQVQKEAVFEAKDRWHVKASVRALRGLSWGEARPMNVDAVRKPMLPERTPIPAPEEEHYHCLAVGVPGDSGLARVAAAIPEDVDMKARPALDRLPQLVMIEEVAHCVAGFGQSPYLDGMTVETATYRMPGAHVLYHERVAQTAAALWHLQEHGDVGAVRAAANLRWARLAHGELNPGDPFSGLAVYHTGPVLDLVLANLGEIRTATWFGDASIVEITRGPAEQITRQSLQTAGLMPDDGRVPEEAWNAYVTSFRKIQAVQSRPDRVVDLSADERQLALRAKRAYAYLTGKESAFDEAFRKAPSRRP